VLEFHRLCFCASEARRHVSFKATCIYLSQTCGDTTFRTIWVQVLLVYLVISKILRAKFRKLPTSRRDLFSSVYREGTAGIIECFNMESRNIVRTTFLNAQKLLGAQQGVLGCAWVCLGVLGCAWVCLGVLGCAWVCLGVLGCACVLGCAWVCLGVLGCAWVCLGVLGCAWVCLGVLGCAWVCLGVLGPHFCCDQRNSEILDWEDGPAGLEKLHLNQWPHVEKMNNYFFTPSFSMKNASSHGSARVLGVKFDGESKKNIRKFAAHFCSYLFTVSRYGTPKQLEIDRKQRQ